MARVTVEDCIKKIPNRFDLVVAACSTFTERFPTVFQIEVERDNDKNPVVSLREIASDAVDPNKFRGKIYKIDAKKYY